MRQRELLREFVTAPPPVGLARLRDDIAADRRVLDRFCDHPGTVLRTYGVDADQTIALGDREKAIIRLFFDPQVVELHSRGELDRLREYILAHHPEVGIANPTDLAGAFAYVDVDVAIIAEAVAVAVAVTAIAVTGSFKSGSTVGKAIEPLAARISVLESRLASLSRLEVRLAELDRRTQQASEAANAKGR